MFVPPLITRGARILANRLRRENPQHGHTDADVGLYVEAKVHDIALGNPVLLAFQA